MSNTHKATTKGFHGPITAVLTLENGKVIEAKSEHSPHELVGGLGIEQTIEQMVSRGDTEIDAVTGATSSSNAYIQAANKAVALSKGEITEAEAMDEDYYLGERPEKIKKEFTDENTSVAERTVFYSPDLTFDKTYDVVIAGAGGAGLSAAVEAARSGLSVLVAEKAGIPGGTTNLSGGVIQAGGTKYQKDFTEFKDDTSENHANLWKTAGEELVDEALVDDLAKGSPGNIEWLADMGLEWDTVYGHNPIPNVPEEYHANRIHQYKGGGGSAEGTVLVKTLLREAEAAGVEVLYTAPVVALVQDIDSQKVHGVKLKYEGQEVLVKANKGVVLATASIDRNPALAKALSPQQYHDLKYKVILSCSTDTGDGIVMGMNSGAAVSGFGGCIDFDGVTGNATNNTIPTFPLIMVNGDGLRFVDENATYAYQYRQVFHEEKQLSKATHMIFGQNSLNAPTCPWDEDSIEEQVTKGAIKKADTIEELAEKLNVPSINLKRTLDTWNEDAKNGVDSSYGRTMGVEPLEGPFYARENVATNLGSLGGLKVNVDCQVIDQFGDVIEGLYAAGLNAGSWIGSYYPGSGTAIAGIIHQGRKAGMHLASK